MRHTPRGSRLREWGFSSMPRPRFTSTQWSPGPRNPGFLPECAHDPRPRYWLMKSEPQECSIDDALAAPTTRCPGRACATTRRATSCATQCRWAMGCCSTTQLPRARHRRHRPHCLKLPHRPHPVRPGIALFRSPIQSRQATLAAAGRTGAAQNTQLIGLAELREHPELAGMRVLQRGNWLSITPGSSHTGSKLPAGSCMRHRPPCCGAT